MPYRIAGVDVHKKMLAVVMADVAVDGEYDFARRRVGTSPVELRELAEWLVAEQVEEVVMESTAQYWRPVWDALERDWAAAPRGREGASVMAGTLHLAQAQSNRGASGRKKDFPDAERLVRRLVAQELTLSFVPDGEQRLWRAVMRRKYQVTRNRVQVQNRLECLLEEAHLKLSSLVSDLLGRSARRMLQVIAEGETDPAKVTALADYRLRATPEQLARCARRLRRSPSRLSTPHRHGAGGCARHRRADRCRWIQEMAHLLGPHQAAVQRLAAVPGLGVDSAQQIIAEVGPTAATFPSPKHLASWVGACPGDEESAGVNYSHRSPKGNRQMRRAAQSSGHAAVKTKGLDRGARPKAAAAVTTAAPLAQPRTPASA